MNGRLLVTGALAMALLAVSGGSAIAQESGRNWTGERGGRRDNNEWNRPHRMFNDRDRLITRDWYLRNQRHLGRGWAHRDRLPPALERRLRRGARLDHVLRGRMYWLPADLVRLYGPPPRGYRYAIIGGNIVLIDRDYYVRDVFRFDIRIR
jgi:Ni/Co efflux regulator RcnB